MEIDRVAEIIRKAKALLPHIKDEGCRKLADAMVNSMEDKLRIIRERQLPCPPELEDKLEKACVVIENLYNKAATN